MVTKRAARFRAGHETLAGLFVLADKPDAKPELLFLHGAGNSTKDRSLPIAVKLASDYGISSFAFDFSGHGESTGNLQESSLKKRLDEARVALAFAGFDEKVSLCGFSMGGHIALELSSEISVRGLILFYPAVYADQAFDLRFGPEFSSVIRQENSWRNSRLFDAVRTFAGNLLIVVGEQDRVIPFDVSRLLLEHATAATATRLVTVPNAPHVLLPELYRLPDLFSSVCDTMSQYISSGCRGRAPSMPIV
jgi:uncharacterized protein